jgi:hypothetical protein
MDSPVPTDKDKGKSKSPALPSSSPLPPCPVCFTGRIHIPFQTNCGHVYCYMCLYDLSLVASSAAAAGTFEGDDKDRDSATLPRRLGGGRAHCLMCQSSSLMLSWRSSRQSR